MRKRNNVNPLSHLRRAGVADIVPVTALQHAAYARNRPTLGVEPLPLMADYADVFCHYEVWMAEGPSGLRGVLIMKPRTDDLLVWSVATAPQAQGQGVGNMLLAAAEARARDYGVSCVRLYTGEKLIDNIAWYGRHGYVRECTEDMGDRALVHLVKYLDDISRA
jgi:GNAT superfamily N-acetyltransferase